MPYIEREVKGWFYRIFLDFFMGQEAQEHTFPFPVSLKKRMMWYTDQVTAAATMMSVRICCSISEE